MINYIEELDRLASQGEGGGDPPSKTLTDGTVLFQYKEKNAAGQDVYVWKDKSGKKYGGGSIDQNTAWAKAQRYSETEAYQPNYDEKKLPAGTYVEQVDQDGETVFTARNISNNQLVGAPAKSVEELYGTSNIGAGNTLPEYEVVAERKPPPMSAGGQNFDWDVRFGDGRTARYNIPAATRGEFDDIIGSNLRPENQDLGIQRADMVASPMQPRVPGVAPSAGGMQPLAGGSNIANAVLQGAALQSGGAGSIVTGSQGVGTPTKPAPGQQQDRVPRQRGGGGSWSAPGETQAFTQEDFYANTGPLIGQYSTGTEYVATPGRLPMGAISKAATILNNRQVEHDKKRQAFMEELYKPIKTATPYQQNFNQIVRKRQDGFIQSVADAYTGGNISKAHRRVMSDPELRAKWRQLNADLEALGANGQQIFDRAEKYLADSATLDIESTPENRQLAKDILYGLGGYAAKDGTGGDFESLTKKINQFDNLLAREKFFAETVVKSVKDFAAQKSLDYTDIRKGGFMFLTETDKKEYDSQIDAYARRMAVYGYGSYDEMKDWLTKMLPKVEIKKTSASAIPRATRGDGPGGGDPKAGVYYEAVASTQQKPKAGASKEKQEYESVTSNVTKKARGLGADIPENVLVDNLMFFETSGGRQAMPRVVTIGNQAIVPVSVFTDKRGDVYLVAKSSKYAGAGKQEQGGGMNMAAMLESMRMADGSIDIDKFNNLEDIVMPYKQARGFIQQASGGMLTSEAVIRDQINQGRIAQGRQPIDWNAVLSGRARASPPPSSTPSERTKYTINGKEYTWSELSKMGYTADEVSQYMNK